MNGRELKLKQVNAFTYTSQEAWRSSADLQVVLSDLGAVEHGVETGHLVDLHWSHLENLGDLVHCGESEEVVVLLLSDEKSWDAAR
jgi:hypothetical protein